MASQATRRDAGFFHPRFSGTIASMRLPRRRTLWLGAVLLLVVIVLVGGWLFVPQGRITRENFDRIRIGMAKEDVLKVLGPPSETLGPNGTNRSEFYRWRNGASWIDAIFSYESVERKAFHSAPALETLTWYAKKGAAKIGVKWD